MKEDISLRRTGRTHKLLIECMDKIEENATDTGTFYGYFVCLHHWQKEYVTEMAKQIITRDGTKPDRLFSVKTDGMGTRLLYMPSYELRLITSSSRYLIVDRGEVRMTGSCAPIVLDHTVTLEEIAKALKQ